MTSKEMKAAVMTGKKLKPDEALEKIEELRANGEKHDLIIKVRENEYSKWYEGMKKDYPLFPLGTLEEECTYLTDTEEKAFDPTMIGFSIFAISLAEKQRKENDPKYGSSYDRIEYTPQEWVIIL